VGRRQCRTRPRRKLARAQRVFLYSRRRGKPAAKYQVASFELANIPGVIPFSDQPAFTSFKDPTSKLAIGSD